MIDNTLKEFLFEASMYKIQVIKPNSEFITLKSSQKEEIFFNNIKLPLISYHYIGLSNNNNFLINFLRFENDGTPYIKKIMVNDINYYDRKFLVKDNNLNVMFFDHKDVKKYNDYEKNLIYEYLLLQSI